MPKQKNRKTFFVVSVGMSGRLLAEVDAAVEQQKQNTRGVPLNRSTWIVRAIQRDLDHARRSRRANNDLGSPSSTVDSAGSSEAATTAPTTAPAGEGQTLHHGMSDGAVSEPPASD